QARPAQDAQRLTPIPSCVIVLIVSSCCNPIQTITIPPPPYWLHLHARFVFSPNTTAPGNFGLGGRPDPWSPPVSALSPGFAGYPIGSRGVHARGSTSDRGGRP